MSIAEAEVLYHSKGYDECMPFYEFIAFLERNGFTVSYD